MMNSFGLVAFAALLAVAGSAQAADAPAKQTDRNAPDYVRCIRTPETGSLIKKNKICRTNAEWRKVNDTENKDAQDLIERSRAGMNPSG